MYGCECLKIKLLLCIPRPDSGRGILFAKSDISVSLYFNFVFWLNVGIFVAQYFLEVIIHTINFLKNEKVFGRHTENCFYLFVDKLWLSKQSCCAGRSCFVPGFL